MENRGHYVRDVSFFNDLSCIEIKPGHFARCRSFALNIPRADAITDVARELYINAPNLNNAMSYLVT